MPNPNTCAEPGCSSSSVARRLCRRHYQVAWRAGRLDQHAKQPPRVRAREGHVCPDDHKHAEASTCFIQHQCGCNPCRLAHNAREVRRRKLKAYGRFDTGLVDATPVREHILALGEYGIGYKRVAELAGVGVTGVRTLVWGRQDPGPRHGEIPKRVNADKARRILAVQPVVENLPDGGLTSAVGTRRRLQALVANGWSLSKLAQRLGVDVGNLVTMLGREHVTAGRHRAVKALFEELWDKQPPRSGWHDAAAFTRARRHAAARRWLPPLAWDDIDADPEPPAVEGGDDVVDEIAVELAMAGEGPRLTPAEHHEAVRRLHRERWSDGRIAAALRCADKTVLRIREELGLEAFDHAELIQRGAA